MLDFLLEDALLPSGVPGSQFEAMGRYTVWAFWVARSGTHQNRYFTFSNKQISVICLSIWLILVALSFLSSEIMAKRLVRIITDKLLSLDEAFARLGTSSHINQMSIISHDRVQIFLHILLTYSTPHRSQHTW